MRGPLGARSPPGTQKTQSHHKGRHEMTKPPNRFFSVSSCPFVSFVDGQLVLPSHTAATSPARGSQTQTTSLASARRPQALKKPRPIGETWTGRQGKK